MLMTDFIAVYTKGVEDAQYIQPLFSSIITLAFAMRAIRIPYNYLILAAGHYKQTQSCYIIAMLLNIVISIITVKAFGLVGVAVGTLIAMTYQTIWMALYDYKNLVILPKNRFIKQMLADSIIFITGIICTFRVSMSSISYFSWIIKAIFIFIIWIVIIFGFNLIFYKSEMLQLKNFVKRKAKI